MIEDAGRHLGVAVAGLVNLLNPEVIVLGGQMAAAWARSSSARCARSLERCAIPSAAASVELRERELETDADMVGAAGVRAAALPPRPTRAFSPPPRPFLEFNS